MVIISAYVAGETYGLLGPQMAATIISAHTPFEAIVVGVTRQDDKQLVQKALRDFFGPQPGQVLMGFSTIGGRDDILDLAAALKEDGALTISAGPQAAEDYQGETGWRRHAHRFKGFGPFFDYALKGPAQQIVPLLCDLEAAKPDQVDGLLYPHGTGTIRANRPCPWQRRYLRDVNWDNLYRLEKDRLVPLKVGTGQVLQQIGCPYAAKSGRVRIDPPAFMKALSLSPVALSISGCSFCDVAVDKGYCGALKLDDVLAQIVGLPRAGDGRKIPFELINENPFVGLQRLLSACDREGLNISQINLTTRADFLCQGADRLEAALGLAKDMQIRLLLSSVGFEAFDDTILENLNKGVTVADNLKAIKQMRELKNKFPQQLGYWREEGGNHGFIHPTPWDNAGIRAQQDKVIAIHNLAADIIPNHSTPLIIHHASGLGTWARAIEKQAGIKFARHGSIIGWWQVDDKYVI